MSINVVSWFTDLPSPPEHVVACAFEANLPFAEHEILDRLHRNGARHLTVLVGARDYTESFADLAATRHAGVFYAFHRVRLPGRLAAFHPKLYLFTWHDSARLLVSSANLTPTGFRSNLEVADELTLVADEPSDKSAFLEYAAFLDDLARIDPTLAPHVSERLQSASRAVRELADRTTQRGDGAVLLHSASAPLLDQLRGLVGKNVIKKITLVSPFFDDRSIGVLSFVRAFSDGNTVPAVRLIKDWNATGELDGGALVDGLGERVTLERLRGLDASPSVHRALHAKVVLLESAKRAWLVVGSANATAAAWGRSARDGGNLEAITVRALSTHSARRLLNELATDTFPHHNLTRELQDIPDEETESACVIHSATLVDGTIELRCSNGPWFSSAIRIDARLTSREGSAVIPLSVQTELGDQVVLRTRQSSDLLHTDIAVAVVVGVQDSSRYTRLSSAAWLDKPLYQQLEPGLRAGVSALCQLGDQAFVDTANPLHDAAQFLANLTIHIASDLALARPLNPAAFEFPINESGEDGGEQDEEWDDSDLESFEGDANLADVPHLPGGASNRRMRGLHLEIHLQMAQRLFDGVIATGLRDFEDDEEFENAAAKRRISRLRRGIPGQRSEDEARVEAISPSAKRLLETGLTSLERSITRVLRMQWTPDRVPYLTAAIDALCAALLRFAQHSVDWDTEFLSKCCTAWQNACSRVWSIDGYLLGRARGLYPRAIADRELGKRISEAYSQADRKARVAALLAMGSAICRPAGTSAAIVPTGVLRGFLSVSGGPPLDDADVRHRIDYYLAGFAENLQLDAGNLRQSLIVPRLIETSEGALLRTWLPIIRKEEARLIGGNRTSERSSPPSRDTRPVDRRYCQVVAAGRFLGSIVSTTSGIACNRCQSSLPSEWRAKILLAEFIPVCESCGSLLAPIAWQHSGVASILAGLEASLTRELRP